MPVEGLSETLRAFDSFEQAVEQRVMGVVTRTAAGVRDRAKSLVRVDTGMTRDAITYTYDRRTGVANVFVAGDARKGSRPMNLPLWIERGTVYWPARPFLWPAAEHYRASFQAELQQVVDQTVMEFNR